jgi:Zn-dependent peptidase ImmA (M78 family)
VAGEEALGVPPWKQGEDAALALRLRLNYGNRPVNVWDAIRKVGAGLALEDFGEDGGDGRYLNKEGRALIIVNRAKRITRQRFTAAHELGHHDMHRHGRPNFVIRDDDIFGHLNDPLEVAANAFAGNFLAPDAGLAETLGDKRNNDVAPEDVVSLMGDFGLSYEATIYRLHNARLVTATRRDELLAAGRGNVDWLLAELGVDEDKVLPNKAALHLPPDYVEHVSTLWRHRHISDVRFAEMLRLTPEDAERYRERHDIARPELPDYDHEAASKLLEELA